MNIKKFYDSANAYLVNLRAKATLTANRIQTLPDASGEVVLDTSTQTLTNKTLTTPVIDGVTYSTNNNRQIVTKAVAISGDAVHTAVTSLLQLPAEAIILRVILNVTTQSTGASTVDIGYTAVSAITASDTILDGIDSGAGASINDSGDAGLDTGGNDMAQLAASGKWITICEKTGDTSGMVATAYIQYILV